MPLYEYECPACGERFELIESHTAKPRKTCPDCKSRRLRRLVSAPAVHFKGSGWYVTDYADSKGKKKEPGNGEASPAKTGEDSGAATPAKPDRTDKSTVKKEAAADSSSTKSPDKTAKKAKSKN